MISHLLRVIAAFVCLVLCLLGLVFVQDGFSLTLPVMQANPRLTVRVKGGTAVFEGHIAASHALVRIAQLDPAQYETQEQYRRWSPSTCSTTSLTEVLNAYAGVQRYRIADVLKEEVASQAISPDLGLLSPAGIDRTVARFGFKALWLADPTIETVVAVANSGRPVMVDFPPDRWPGGHLLVVRGGDGPYVELADSSSLNMQKMTYQTFSKYWAGFAVVIVPNE